jgi:tetratricopeptide (TPR) repeat protein
MKTSFFALLVAGSLSAAAQTVDEGKSFIQYERYNSAANTLHQVIQKDPANAEAWYWLAHTYAQTDRSAKGLDSLKLAGTTIQDNPLYKVALGQLLLMEGKAGEAQPYFDAALKETKEKDAEVLAAVARAHIDSKSGNYTAAIELLEKAKKRDKRNEELDILMGNAYRRMGNGSEAFQAYREALNKNERSAAANYQLGLIFVTQKNVDMYMDYFNKALAADPNYAPALYQLYNHYFYVDAAKAMDYFNQYLAKTDATPKTDVLYTDLLYLNKQYDAAIANANKLLQRQEKEPRLYKLLAYSYADKKDSATAMSYMQQYFATEVDSNLVMKDFETMADFYANTPGKEDSATAFLEKAIALEKDSVARYAYYKKLAGTAQEQKNYDAQAKWLGLYYTGNEKATNLDLFNWGLASFRGGDYTMADSVFGMYVTKYPEQGFGYYWQARANAALDKEMEQGLAVPHYQKLVEVIGDKTEDANNKKWLIEAFAYLAAYETNTQKNYAEAVDYFEKLLEVDPENADAKKYITVLEKRMQDSDGK